MPLASCRRTVPAASGALILALAVSGCSGATEPELETRSQAATTPACVVPPACNPSIQVPVDPSLIVPRTTHAALLDANFQMTDVLNQLISQAGATETAAELYRRLWDTYNNLAGARFTETFAPHCTLTTKGGLPLDCPRTGDGNNAIAGVPTDFIPVAVVNRFDLASTSGANCGEYRIVYWSRSSTNTGTVIFEAQLPNPNPSCGVEACRPVADFWKSLAGADEATLGAKLRGFYFNGLPGFRPAIHVQNYGLPISTAFPGPTGGQIRVNTISSGPWQLREMQLGLGAAPTGNKLFLRPVTDKVNPFGGFFDINSPLGNAAAFRTDFVGTGQVTSLAAGNLNNIAMSTNDKYNPFQSTSQNVGLTPDDYIADLPRGANNSFTQAIVAALPPGSTLTADDIVERATTQSCAGCHQISNNRNLGGGLVWPSSGADGFGFVHLGPAGSQSPALRCVFLPHRQSVLSGFEQSCGTLPPEIIPSTCPTSTTTLGAPAQSGATLGGGSGVN